MSPDVSVIVRGFKALGVEVEKPLSPIRRGGFALGFPHPNSDSEIVRNALRASAVNCNLIGHFVSPVGVENRRIAEGESAGNALPQSRTV